MKRCSYREATLEREDLIRDRAYREALRRSESTKARIREWAHRKAVLARMNAEDILRDRAYRDAHRGRGRCGSSL